MIYNKDGQARTRSTPSLKFRQACDVQQPTMVEQSELYLNSARPKRLSVRFRSHNHGKRAQPHHERERGHQSHFGSNRMKVLVVGEGYAPGRCVDSSVHANTIQKIVEIVS